MKLDVHPSLTTVVEQDETEDCEDRLALSEMASSATDSYCYVNDKEFSKGVGGAMK